MSCVRACLRVGLLCVLTHAPAHVAVESSASLISTADFSQPRREPYPPPVPGCGKENDRDPSPPVESSSPSAFSFAWSPWLLLQSGIIKNAMLFEVTVLERHLHPTTTADLLAMATTGRQPKCPSMDERIETTRCLRIDMDTVRRYRKEGGPVVGNNADEPRQLYAKGSKSGRQR